MVMMMMMMMMIMMMMYTCKSIYHMIWTNYNHHQSADITLQFTCKFARENPSNKWPQVGLVTLTTHMSSSQRTQTLERRRERDMYICNIVHGIV